jgi:hypothetical protein
MTQHQNKRRYASGFSIVGCFLIIALCVFINYTTSRSFPWFIFPAFAVLWWPLGVIFAGKHNARAFSLIGSLLIILLLFFTNYITSWSHPWFIYPSIAVIWWPLALFIGVKNPKVFAIVSSIAITIISVVVNIYLSPSYIWFYYPIFAVLWWPLSVYLGKPRTNRIFAVIGALYTLVFLAVNNYYGAPSVPWVLLTVYPLLMWPISQFLGKEMGRLAPSIILSAAGIIYYILLNILAFPSFPWSVITGYAILWWPLSVALAKRRFMLIYSVGGFILNTLFFSLLNIIASPHTIWAIYPIFALAWWPLSVYYFIYKKSKKTA